MSSPHYLYLTYLRHLHRRLIYLEAADVVVKSLALIAFLFALLPDDWGIFHFILHDFTPSDLAITLAIQGVLVFLIIVFWFTSVTIHRSTIQCRRRQDCLLKWLAGDDRIISGKCRDELQVAECHEKQPEEWCEELDEALEYARKFRARGWKEVLAHAMTIYIFLFIVSVTHLMMLIILNF